MNPTSAKVGGDDMFHYTTVRESYSSVSTPLLSYDPTRIDQILLGTLKLLAESTVADLS